MELCKSLWYIISCYREISKWHAAHPSRKQGNISLRMTQSTYTSKGIYFVGTGSPGSITEDSAASQYVRQKLEMGRTRVWHDIQAKVAALLMGCEPSEFKVEEFLRVLDLVDT